jgi:hypothetical protein
VFEFVREFILCETLFHFVDSHFDDIAPFRRFGGLTARVSDNLLLIAILRKSGSD